MPTFAQIENEARRLQYEIWHHRGVLFQSGEPPLRVMFDPSIAAHVLGFNYESRERLAAIDELNRFEAAGILDKARRTIVVSRRFKVPVQRFSGAHEVGHLLLRHFAGDAVVHRDRPPNQFTMAGRPRFEVEADYFAACFLAPKKPVIESFKARFLDGPPLKLDHNIAFHLKGEHAHELFLGPHGSLDFAVALASASRFGRLHFESSLADEFGLSVSAMAVRIQELGLVAG